MTSKLPVQPKVEAAAWNFWLTHWPKRPIDRIMHLGDTNAWRANSFLQHTLVFRPKGWLQTHDSLIGWSAVCIAFYGRHLYFSAKTRADSQDAKTHVYTVTVTKRRGKKKNIVRSILVAAPRPLNTLVMTTLKNPPWMTINWAVWFWFPLLPVYATL